VEEVIQELNNPDSFRSKVFYPYIEMIKTRKKQPAFHPNAEFQILELEPRVFAIRRASRDQILYALTNISSSEVTVAIPNTNEAKSLTDKLSGESFAFDNISLNPYQYVWLTLDQY
jgi:sucrose phosphorylase